MTLKCPTCQKPVDPYPDACSAVMCLYCGNHYCNYCFEAFATGVSTKDKADAHLHAAAHSESVVLEERDAFLSAERIAVGQRLHQFNQIVKCLSSCMPNLRLQDLNESTNGSSSKAVNDNKNDESNIQSSNITSSTFCGFSDSGMAYQYIAIVMISCNSELKDLNINISEIWEAITGITQVSCKAVVKELSSGEGSEKVVVVDNVGDAGGIQRDVVVEFEEIDEDDEEEESDEESEYETIDGDEEEDNEGEEEVWEDMEEGPNDGDDHSVETETLAVLPPAAQSTGIVSDNHLLSPRPPSQGAVLLGNAFISQNNTAVDQIISSYTHESDENYIDANYIEPTIGHPICALAVVCNRIDVAIMLLKKGANPYKSNRVGRNLMSIAVEFGKAEMVRAILDLHPNFDLNATTTIENHQYRPIHVAVR